MLLFSAMATTTNSTQYDQTVTVTQYSTTQTTSSGVIDKVFIKSIPGILKLVEMVQHALSVFQRCKQMIRSQWHIVSRICTRRLCWQFGLDQHLHVADKIAVYGCLPQAVCA